MIRLSIMILVMLCSTATIAQNHIVPETAINAQVNQYNQTYFIHQIKQGETLYSLAKYYKIAMTDLLLVNKMKSGDSLPLGASLIIPLAVEHIQSSSTKNSETWTPIFYKVKRKETLYKIAKVYFPQKLEDLIRRNNTTSFAVKPGEELLVGWWAAPRAQKDISDLTRRIKQRLQERLELPASQDNLPTPAQEKEIITELDVILTQLEEERNSETQDTVVTEFNYKKGIAYWNKEGHDRENLFVMHSKAKPNSYISLRYPVTGKEVTAQVISTIPSNLYAEDIDLVITPAVAQALGALDSRFEIQMDYYE